MIDESSKHESSIRVEQMSSAIVIDDIQDQPPTESTPEVTSEAIAVLTGVEIAEVDEALEYIQALIVNHLEGSVKIENGPLEGDQRSKWISLIRKIVIDCAKANDPFFATILLAFVTARAAGSKHLVATIDNVMMFALLDEARFQTYIYDTISTLLDHDATKGNAVRLSHACALYVRDNDGIFRVKFHDILSFFWDAELDTLCDFCHGSFVDDPPIRTISLSDWASHDQKIRHEIRIYDRHLKCLKAQRIPFVPVSHVWTDAVREANETQNHNDTAASQLLETLMALHEGVKGAFDEDVELWHDYFSVPQWNRKVKETLLFCLPVIFNIADEILIHMDDLSSPSVIWFLENAAGSRISILRGIQGIRPNKQLFSSKWSKRMWVQLEHSLCSRAGIMDQSNKIWRPNQNNYLYSSNHDDHPDLLYSLIGGNDKAKRFFLSKGSLFLGRQMLKTHVILFPPVGGECLGQVFSLLMEKKCLYNRDRFLATYITTYITTNYATYAEQIPQIPQSDLNAFMWIWSEALRCGDYSPLLLQPLKSDQRKATKNQPSWWIGDDPSVAVKWGLQGERSRPPCLPKVRGLRVLVRCHVVGLLTKACLTATEGEGFASTVDRAMQLIMSTHDVGENGFCVHAIIKHFHLTFPWCTGDSEYALKENNVPYSLKSYIEQDEGFIPRLQMQLDAYSNSIKAGDAEPERRAIVQKIIDMLQLDKEILPFISASNRISRAQKQRLYEIKCTSCYSNAFMRLELRDDGQIGDKIYRIPGLSYEGSAEDGVGIVIRDGKIVGRMIYGIPICDCKIEEEVEIS